MKNILLFTLFLFSVSIASSQEISNTITVSVSNISSDEGKVIMSLHSEDTFMKTAPVQMETALIDNGKASVTFKNVEPGVYGIIGFHDKNNNDRIDMSSNGMPVESYGVSNNPMNFGPPQWSEAKFEVLDQPLNLEIRF